MSSFPSKSNNNGWQTVDKYNQKKKRNNNNNNNNKRSQSQSRSRSTTVKKPIAVTAKEMNEFDPTEVRIFTLLRSAYPKGLTAIEIAEQLTLDSTNETVYTKEDIGNYLYDGDLNDFVENDGRPPNRKWAVKSQINDE